MWAPGPTSVEPMHVGVYAPIDPRNGGVAQYSLAALRALDEPPTDIAARVTYFASKDSLAAARSVGCRHLEGGDLPPGRRLTAWVRRVMGYGRFGDLARSAYGLVRRVPEDSSTAANQRSAFRERMSAAGIDLLFVTSPLRQALESPGPAVIAIHDLYHRRLAARNAAPEDQRSSAEIDTVIGTVGARGGWFIAESETGRRDLIESFPVISGDRVFVVPYTVPPYFRPGQAAQEADRVRLKHRLPQRYLVYPAHFWPHKNHRVLVEALGLLGREDKLDIPLVLTGDASGPLRRRTLASMWAAARANGVADRIRHLGLADNEDMTGLFAGAFALVMPSLVGPSNLPIIEAWSVGCPVITSAVHGIPEMCGDAALLVDPESPESVAAAIRDVWMNDSLRAALVEAGQRRMSRHSEAEFRRGLWAALAEAGGAK